MARQLQTDRVLFGTVVVLLLFGLIMVFSASAVIAQDGYGSSYHFLFRQGFWAIIGLVFMVVMMNFDYRRLARPTVIFPALAIQLLLLLVALFQSPVHNTHRWVHMGRVAVQPSELSKSSLLFPCRISGNAQGRNRRLETHFVAHRACGWRGWSVDS